MEVGVIRRLLKRGKVWNALAEDVKNLPERKADIGQALPSEIKRMLFEMAGSKPAWRSRIARRFWRPQRRADALRSKISSGAMLILSADKCELDGAKRLRAFARFRSRPTR